MVESTRAASQLAARHLVGRIVPERSKGRTESDAHLLKGLLLARGLDHRFAVVHADATQRPRKMRTQRFQAKPRRRRDDDVSIVGIGVGIGPGSRRAEIGLAAHAHGYGPVGDTQERGSGRRDDDNDVGAFDLLSGADDAGLFDRMERGTVVIVADASDVDQRAGDAGELDGCLEHVPGRARFVMDERPGVADEGVEQCRLAGVGGSVQDHPRPFDETPAARRGAQQALQLGARLLERPAQAGPIGAAYRLVGKIESCLEFGEDIDERTADRRQPRGQAAAERPLGGLQRSDAARADHSVDRFGAGEVDPPAEHRTERELAGSGRATAEADEHGKDTLDDERRAVQRELDDVLAGEAVRCAERRDERLVDHGRAVWSSSGFATAVGGGVDDVAEHREPRWRFAVASSTDDAVAHGECAGTADADDGEGRATRRGRQRADGVAAVEIEHGGRIAHPDKARQTARMRSVSFLPGSLLPLVVVVAWSMPAEARHGGLYLELGTGYGFFDSDEVIVDHDKGQVASSSFAPTLKLGVNLFGWAGVEAVASGHYWGLGADLGGGAYGGGNVRLTPLEVLTYALPADFTMWSPQGEVGWKDRPFDVGVSFGGGYTIVGEDYAYQGSYFQWGLDAKFFVTPNFAVGIDLPFRTPTYQPFRYTNFSEGDGLCTDGEDAFSRGGLAVGFPWPVQPQRPGDEFNATDLSPCDGDPPAASFFAPSFTIAGVFDFGV